MSLAVITGAGSGIGRAVAHSLSQSGMDVFLVGRTETKLNSVFSELKGLSFAHACDLTNPNQTNELVDRIRELSSEGNPLEVLVNNAGTFETRKLSESDDDHWRNLWESNFMSHVRLTRLLLPLLKIPPQASIVNVSSTLGLGPVAGTGAYSAAKAALVNWTQTLALELAPANIRVNCICPGLVETPIHGLDQKDEGEREQWRKKMSMMQPMGRVGRPEEIAGAVAYFCSPLSSWTTGSILNIDGGISLI